MVDPVQAPAPQASEQKPEKNLNFYTDFSFFGDFFSSEEKVDNNDQSYLAFVKEYEHYCTPTVSDQILDYGQCESNSKTRPYYLIKKPGEASKWQLFYVSDDFADEEKTIKYQFSVVTITEGSLTKEQSDSTAPTTQEVLSPEQQTENAIKKHVESMEISERSPGPLLIQYDNNFYTYREFTDDKNESCVKKVVFGDNDGDQKKKLSDLLQEKQGKQKKIVISYQKTPDLFPFFVTDNDRKKLLTSVKTDEVVNLDKVLSTLPDSPKQISEDQKLITLIRNKLIAHRAQSLGINLSDFPSRLNEEGAIANSDLGTIADIAVILAENKDDQGSTLAAERDKEFLDHTQAEMLTPALSFFALIEAFALYYLLKNKNDAFRKTVNVWYRSFKTMSIVGYDFGCLIVDVIPFLPPGFSKVLSILVGSITGLVFGLITGLVYHFLSPYITQLFNAINNDLSKEDSRIGKHFPIFKYAHANNIEFTRLGKEGWSKYGKAGLVLGLAIGAAFAPLCGPLAPLAPLIGALCGFLLAIILMPIINMIGVYRSTAYKSWLKKEAAPKKEYELVTKLFFSKTELEAKKNTEKEKHFGKLYLKQDDQDPNKFDYTVLSYKGEKVFEGLIDIAKLNIRLSQLDDETLNAVRKIYDQNNKKLAGKLDFTVIDLKDNKIRELILADSAFKSSLLKETTNRKHTRPKDLSWRTNYLRTGISIGYGLGYFIGGAILFCGGVSLTAIGSVAVIAAICAIALGLVCHFALPYLCRNIDPDNMLKSSIDYDLRASVFCSQFSIGDLIVFCLDKSQGITNTGSKDDNDSSNINKDLGLGIAQTGMAVLTVIILLVYYKKSKDLSAKEFKKKYQEFLPRSQRVTSGVVVGIIVGSVIAGALCFIPGVGLSFGILSLICVGIGALVFGLAAAALSEKTCEKMTKIEKKYIKKLAELEEPEQETENQEQKSKESKQEKLSEVSAVNNSLQSAQQTSENVTKLDSLAVIQGKLKIKKSQSESPESYDMHMQKKALTDVQKKSDENTKAEIELPINNIELPGQQKPKLIVNASTVTTQEKLSQAIINQSTDQHKKESENKSSAISQDNAQSSNLRFKDNLFHCRFNKTPNRENIDCEQSLLGNYKSV